MRKPISPRIFFIVLLYFGVFVLLVSVQFAKRAGFTMKLGSLVVSGQYRQSGEDGPPPPGEYYLDGEVHVFFGGMDFGMIRGNDGCSLRLEGEAKEKIEALPERMMIAENAVRFVFPGGTELEFSVLYAGDFPEMRITGVFSENITGIELPFKLQRRTGIKNVENSSFIAIADGLDYTFGNSPIDAERRMLLVNAGGKRVSYRAIPDGKTNSPDYFILPQAETVKAYNEFLSRWRERNFPLWNRAVSEQNNEYLVLALAEEALAQGNYRAALAAVSQAFLRGNNRTHESSVYLGGLEEGYRTLGIDDREKTARLSRQINGKSLEFLFEPRVFEFFAARGNRTLFDAGSELVRTIDPDILALDIVPGIFEGYADWKIFRPGADNPFENLLEAACSVVSESLRRTTNTGGNQDDLENLVFVFYEGQGEAEFNLRLGKALAAYAEAAKNELWAGIGRSLVISTLSRGEAAGSESNTAKFYHLLSPVSAYPRALTLSAPVGSTSAIWTWTAARSASAVLQGDVLDISVNFPAGEIHYMIIRGIRPFGRIQLHDMNFRSDPQFERYDSPGWMYVPQEQTLLVKMKHRTALEHIRIIYRIEPEPEPEQDETKGVNTDANTAVREGSIEPGFFFHP